jgi:hypothetical protein
MKPGFNSWQGQRIFLFATMCRLALRPTQPPVQWVLGGGRLSPGVKQPGHEASSFISNSAKGEGKGKNVTVLN